LILGRSSELERVSSDVIKAGEDAQIEEAINTKPVTDGEVLVRLTEVFQEEIDAAPEPSQTDIDKIKVTSKDLLGEPEPVVAPEEVAAAPDPTQTEIDNLPPNVTDDKVKEEVVKTRKKIEAVKAEHRASEERFKALLREKEAEISALRSGALTVLASLLTPIQY
jgi:hypothetical protein